MCREAAPFTTPDAIAADAQKALRGFPGIGHDVYIETECGRTVVSDFLSRPDSFDAGCADTMRIPDFVT
jgi:hypothetical protein